MLTLQKLLDEISIERSAIDVVNKLVFQPRKAYTTSVDGKTYFEFGSKLTEHLKRITAKLRNRTYQFAPLKLIQKRTKKKIRDIYLSTWGDKIVETWLNDCLNITLHEWFDKNSYAYRIQDLGLDACQNRLSHIMQFCKYFVKRDISQYFYSINHELLLHKLAEVVDRKDFLFALIEQRVRFKFMDKHKQFHDAKSGVPFGSAIACTLSNIFLTDVDKLMRTFNIYYFRYADDILIAGPEPTEVKKAALAFDNAVQELKLNLKQSHSRDFAFVEAPGFEKVSKFCHLGLEYMFNGIIKFAVEKQRKVLNFFKRELNRRKKQIRKLTEIDAKLKWAIDGVNMMVQNRIRCAAIVDYYLKHVNDETQLKNMDRLVAEMVISHVLDKPFRKGDFKIIPYKKLRQMNLLSLLHRNRLHRHGHLRVNFLSLHNELVFKRYQGALDSRRARIDHMRLARKIKKESSNAS